MDLAGVGHGGGDGDAIVASPRQGAAGDGVFLIEYAGKGGKFTLSRPGVDILTDERLADSVSLSPYQVRVIRYD